MSDSIKKSQIRKNAILKAAQELFHEKGFQKTAIIDIMKRVGAAKGVFYYYFDSKENVLDALVNLNISRIEVSMTDIANKSSIDAIDKLKFMISEEIRLSFENYDFKNHVHDIQNVDMHQKIMVATNLRISPLIGMVVKQGIHEGSFHVEYPLETAEILMAGVHFILDLGIFRRTEEQYMDRIKATAELIEKALSLKKGSFAFLADLLRDVPKITKLISDGAKQ